MKGDRGDRERDEGATAGAERGGTESDRYPDRRSEGDRGEKGPGRRRHHLQASHQWGHGPVGAILWASKGSLLLRSLLASYPPRSKASTPLSFRGWPSSPPLRTSSSTSGITARCSRPMPSGTRLGPGGQNRGLYLYLYLYLWLQPAVLVLVFLTAVAVLVLAFALCLQHCICR